MIIRWLQCYGGSEFTLAETLNHELGENRLHGTRAACAMQVWKKADPEYIIGVPSFVKVGLLCKNSGVVRRFKEDVWSVRNDSGFLKKTRKGCGGAGTHSELWVHPSSYIGIIVRGRWKALSPEKREAVKAASLKHKVPVFVLCNGWQLCEIKF